MADTVKEGLDTANPNSVASWLQKVKLGTFLASYLKPVERERTVASSATQVHDVPATILAVSTGAGGTTARAIITSGVTVGATTVNIAYDAAGVPTFTFNAAVTEYTVIEQVEPTDLAAALAESI